MIETMERSTGDVLGYRISGDVTKADYDTLTPAVGAAIDKHGSVSLLLDLTDFRWEKVSAWGSDLNFGKQFHDSVEKLAIVGNKKWMGHLAKLAQPFFAKEVKFFETDDDRVVEEAQPEAFIERVVKGHPHELIVGVCHALISGEAASTCNRFVGSRGLDRGVRRL